MIIKFKDCDTWVMFGEVDHITYKDIQDDPDKTAWPSDILRFRPSDEDAAVGKWVKMSFLAKNMDRATEIVVCTPIYLMNDQGRTIETI